MAELLLDIFVLVIWSRDTHQASLIIRRSDQWVYNYVVNVDNKLRSLRLVY